MSTYIIAEAGVNHNGNINYAKQLIEIAAEVGANGVKFQTFKASALATQQAPKASYQNTTATMSQFEMLKTLELSEEVHKQLKTYCEDCGIDFLSTPFDLESIELLETLNMPLYKIPSGEITNLPYLRKIGSLKKEIILSTGMANLQEIHDALAVLEQAGTSKKNITILHCNTEYPTPMEDVNLNAMHTIREACGVRVGYSDHTLGIEVSIAAVALGATVIEKHFTLDRNLPGPDHQASLEPDELKAMVTSIRNIEKAMGSGEKIPSPSELKNKAVARKSIVARRPIKKGEVFSEENLGVKRPGTGLNPMDWDKLLKQLATCHYNEDDLIARKELN